MSYKKITELSTYLLLRKLRFATSALVSKLAQPMDAQDVEKLRRKSKQCETMANVAFTRYYDEQKEARTLDTILANISK